MVGLAARLGSLLFAPGQRIAFKKIVGWAGLGLFSISRRDAVAHKANFRVMVLVFLVAGASACQSDQDTGTSTPLSSITAISLSQARTLIPPPTAATVTPLTTPTSLTVADSTVAAPEPTPSQTPASQPTATLAPEPTQYLVEPGDTLSGIAAQFQLPIEALLYANGETSADEFVLVAGTEIEIPDCNAYRIMPGNTLSGIAGLCGLTLDELITANIRTLALYGTLDALPTGLVLTIPRAGEFQTTTDCDPQPGREQVIEYLPKPGEGIFCLSQKFGVSTASIVQANVDRLTGEKIYGEEHLLIPPLSGALYTIKPEDISAGVTLDDLADWYEVTPAAITDWNGNPVTGSLSEGQQLYLPGANLASGPFQSVVTTPTAAIEG